jgi:transglutaminase-like putative cysteine protease
MQYTIRHVTKLIYEAPISESVMEARMQPRTEGMQRCIHFRLSTTPVSRVMRYQDHDGNIVHHFNIAGRHSHLVVDADALVECGPPASLPDTMDAGAWARLEALTASGEFWDGLSPSAFTGRTPALERFMAEIGFERGSDPIVTLRRLMEEMHGRFEYAPRTTRVDSPIDEALESRRGVCQDFAHIFIALARQLGVPCRYVSGYLFHRPDNDSRSVDGATHAWAETLLPDLGWVGWDPTNNLPAGDRHVRVAVGRDYADVPPTRGVFKGVAVVRSELAVAVSVGSVRTRPGGDTAPFVPWMSHDVSTPRIDAEANQQQQQQ